MGYVCMYLCKYGHKNKVLYIEDDRSDGTWKQIAKQLKVKYESSDD
jgi:hypothetical protein